MENKNCTRYIKPCINIDKNTKYRKKAYSRLFAVITAFSICSSILPCTKNVSYASVTEGDNVKDEMNEMEESQKVELSLNYSARKIIYGTCSYLSDFEVYNASGVLIDPGEAEWMSSDESVATVKYGTVFINGTGETVITVAYNGNTASCNLEVVKPEVKINKSELKDRLVGDKCTDWYTSTEETDIDIKSGNKKVVKPNDDGSLKVLSLGKSVITVKAENGNTVKYTMNIKKRHLYLSDDETLNISQYIKNIKNYENAVWTVSDPSYIDILEDGTIKPLKPGRVTLNTKLNGKKYKINLRITNYDIMKELAMSALKDNLRYPASLSVNNIMHDGRSVTIDYSSMNKYGGYDRDKFIMKVNMGGEYICETVSIYN